MDAQTLLQQWLNGIKIMEISHRRAATYYNRCGRMLGIPVTILTIIVGTSVFSTLGSSDNKLVLLSIGFLSIIAAVLSGVQTFLNYPELTQRHYAAGIKYGILRRRIEESISFTIDPSELKKLMNDIRDEWDQLEKESPIISQSFHDKALLFVKPDIADKRGIKE